MLRFSRTKKSPDRCRVEASAGALADRPFVGRAGRQRNAAELLAGEDGLDLRMGRVGGDGARSHARPVCAAGAHGRSRCHSPNRSPSEDGPLRAELAPSALPTSTVRPAPDRRGRRSARPSRAGARECPARHGRRSARPHNRCPPQSSRRKKSPRSRSSESSWRHISAPSGAIAVADIVGRRRGRSKACRCRAAAELHFLDQRRGEREGGAVEFRARCGSCGRRRPRGRSARRRPCSCRRERKARAFAWQDGGSGSGGRAGAIAVGKRRIRPPRRSRGTAARLRSVDERLAVPIPALVDMRARPSSPPSGPCRRRRRCGCAGEPRFSRSPRSAPQVEGRHRVAGGGRARRRARPRRNRRPCRRAGGLVDPVVGDDPGARRARAGQDGRMAGQVSVAAWALIAVAEDRRRWPAARARR